MLSIRHAVGLVALLFIVGTPAQTFAQGFAPEEAARRMTVPKGFRVDLVAAEPLVRQPVAIDFDDRGRLWVIQYLQYPNPEGLKRVTVDRYSRTVYDRMPDPPPKGPRGADRISILEDTDGDGRCDRAKDFVTGLNLTTGFAFGHGGVFVLNVPYLLFYPDRDGDDVPDSVPEVCLTGFGMHDAHSVANSLAFGPDGWLYGCQGSTVTANIRGIEFQQGVWRYHPRTKAFELFCEGGGNSWGLDFDDHGQLLYSTNLGGHVMLHGIPGAYLWKAFGKHGALHNPYAFGYYDHVPQKNFTGGHVTAGGILYSGTTFPKEFRGTYIAADLLGHAVRWHTVSPRGTTFSSAHGGDLLIANDSWFAPCDVAQGPDGAVYVADWHDQRTAHPDPDAEWDRTNGRIYRIQSVANAASVSQANAKPAKPDASANPLAVAHLSDVELVERLHGEDGWAAHRARRILSERKSLPIGTLRDTIFRSENRRDVLQSLWTLAAADLVESSLAATVLSHDDEHVRAWAVRLVGDSPTLSASYAVRLLGMAAGDRSPHVRLQLACAAKRLDPSLGVPILTRLVQHDADAADPAIPLSIWWGFERHAVSSQKELVEWGTSPDTWSRPLARDVVLPRLMQRYAAEGTAATLGVCEKVLASSPPSQRRRMLESLEGGLRLIGSQPQTGLLPGDLLKDAAVIASSGKPPATVTNEGRDPATRPVRPGRTDTSPASLQATLVEEWRKQPSDALLTRLSMRVGIAEVSAHVRATALRMDADIPARVAALAILEELGDESIVGDLLPLVGGKEPDAVQSAAIRVLSRYPDERIASRLLENYASLSVPVRSEARDVLFGRRATAAAFLALVDAKKVEPKDVPVEQLRRIALHGDRELDALVRRHWGNVRAGMPEEKLAEVRRLSNDLRAAGGNPSHGRELYRKHCAACHVLFQDGRKIGPDLTHANRKDQAFLLTSLIDPNAQIRKEFLSYIVQTTDGRVLTGLVTASDAASITLADGNADPRPVPRSVIDEMTESTASLMPEELYRQFKPQDLRDLFAYLQRDKPLEP